MIRVDDCDVGVSMSADALEFGIFSEEDYTQDTLEPAPSDIRNMLSCLMKLLRQIWEEIAGVFSHGDDPQWNSDRREE